MHPVLQNVRNASGVEGQQRRLQQQQHLPRGGDPHQQRYRHHQAAATAAPQQQPPSRSRVRPPTPPQYPAQHALPGAAETDAYSEDGGEEGGPPVCGLAAGADIDEIRMRERESGRRGAVPETNLFKASRDALPPVSYTHLTLPTT